MRLVLLSDLHLISFRGLRLRDFFTKRSLAILNLKTLRRSAHSMDVARMAIKKAAELNPNHVIFTGDFSNMALASEFETARELLAPLWDPKRLSVVPGNHDYYTWQSARHGLFESYFKELIWGPAGGTVYPGVKTIGPGVVLLLFRSPMYLPGVFSFGRIDRGQLERADAALRTLKPRVTIAAFHHNLHRRGLWVEGTGRMLDRDRLVHTLMDMGVNMVLTGHDHRHREYTIRRNGRQMQVICSGSSSLIDRGARLTVIDIENNNPSFRISNFIYRNGEFHDESH